MDLRLRSSPPMARPFAVHYLIFCESVEYLDPARPHRDSIPAGGPRSTANFSSAS